HDFLEDLGVFGHGLGAKLVQKEVAGANFLVVATPAVELNGGPLGFGTLRDLVRGLGEDLGVGRNDNDGTRNADKPSSELHISHHLASCIPTDEFKLIVTRETGVEKGIKTPSAENRERKCNPTTAPAYPPQARVFERNLQREHAFGPARSTPRFPRRGAPASHSAARPRSPCCCR